MNNKITTLIFDLGGVIINIDPSSTIKEFNLLAKRNSDILNSLDYKLTDIIRNLEEIRKKWN